MQTVSRLVTLFKPEHYQLSLDIHHPERIFKGTVVINGTLLAGAKHIGVHAKDLTVTSVTIDGKRGVCNAGENDELYLTHPDLVEGRHIIVLQFNGKITNSMHGLYPCHYQQDGVEKELIVTQFESHHAREVFPCIDEPEAKAVFDVTLTTQTGITVLGNMPVKMQEIEEGRYVTTFEPTPSMSTYLLAWVAGELQKKTAITKNGVEVNVWATLAQNPESLDYSLEIARRTIDYFDDYFDTPYPLPKSDHVALPDFSAGAMENWGLITYREFALLANPETSSVSTKRYIAMVVAHEVSHQWFGNLVTMKWWNDLWLNESFATLMSYLALEALYPEWDNWLDFTVQETTSALQRDSIDNIQAIQVDVTHPDEITTLFDPAIVYAKGALVLRMLQQYLGADIFQAGLKEYFTTYAYRNTIANDLWSVFTRVSKKDVIQFMNTWISQPGYPVVTAKRSNDEINLSQERFFIGPHKPTVSVWPIPIHSSSPDLPPLIDQSVTSVKNVSNVPFRLNIGLSAPFLTHYDEGLFSSIIDRLDQGELAALDKLQLLNETLLLTKAGLLSSVKLISLLKSYKSETSEPVWNTIRMVIEELKKFVEDDNEAEKKLKILVRNLVEKHYNQLGWQVKENEPESDAKLRSNIISLMLYSEDSEAIETALTLFNSTEISLLDPELRSLIIGVAVQKKLKANLVEDLVSSYQKMTSDIQRDIIKGLAQTEDQSTLRLLLAYLRDSSVVRTQDIPFWFVALIRNQHGRSLAWKWARDNWGWLEATFRGDMRYDSFPRYISGALSTRKQLEEYRTFFMPLQDVPSLSRVISIGMIEIEGRVDLLERDTDTVRATLSL